MNKEYDLNMEGTQDDEFDEVEETTEYNDVDEDDGEYEYEDDAEEEYEEEPEEEYDEYAEDEYDDEYAEEEPEDEYAEDEYEYEEPLEEYADEEYEPVASSEDYTDRFEQILSELKNLNQNLAASKMSVQQYPMSTYAYGQQNMPQPNQASPNFSCSYTVPAQQPIGTQYADPVLTSEVSRMRDEVLAGRVQQSVQQNSSVLAEITRMREDMAKQNSQNIRQEIMQLKHDLNNNGRYRQPEQQPAPVYQPQPSAPAAHIPPPVQQPVYSQQAATQANIESMFMQNELSRLREELSKGNMTVMSGEVSRLREEINKKELKESMNNEITAIRKDMDAKSELLSVREEMNRLKRELVEAINEKKHRSAAEPAQAAMQPPASGANAEVLETVRALREEMRRAREEAQREKDWERERERRERGELRERESLPTTAAGRTNDSAVAVLDEIKKLREEVASNSVNSSAVISKKIDSVLRGGAEEEKRTQQILRAIGKMFVQSNNAMKGMTDKNETLLHSFTEELRRNVEELSAVRGDIEQADIAGLRGDIENISSRNRSDMEKVAEKNGKQLAGEIGEQLGALAKDVISKVGDKSRQEELYNSLMGLEKKVDMSLRAQARAYQDNSRVTAGMVKLIKNNSAELSEKLDNACVELGSMRACLDKLDDLGAGTERAVNFVVDSLTERVESLKQDLKKNPSAFTDAGRVLGEIEALKGAVKNLTAGAATRTDVENTAVRLRNSIMSDIKNTDLAANVTAIVEKLKAEIAEKNRETAKLIAENSAAATGRMAEANAATLKQIGESNELLAKQVNAASDRLARQVSGVAAGAEEQNRKSAVMFGGIAKMIAKNNGLLQNILNESGKSAQAIVNGEKLTEQAIAQLKESVAQIAARDLGELNSIKKALTKLDDTEAAVAEINSRMQTLNKDVARTVDTLKTEIKNQLTDVDRYSDVNKALEVIKSQVAESVNRMLANGVSGMQKELASEVYAAVSGSMSDISKNVAGASERVIKAIGSIDTAAVTPLVAEVKQSLELGREDRRAMAEMAKRSERMEQRQNEQHEKTMSMFTSMARAMARNNDAVGMLKSAAERNIETISASSTVTKEDIAKLRQTVEKVSADYADSLAGVRRELQSVSGGQSVIKAVDDKLANLAADMAKAIASLKEDVSKRIADSDKSEIVNRALDNMARELKKELAENLDRNAAVYTELHKRTEEIRRAQEDAARRSGSVYSGIARAMMSNNRELTNIKGDISALKTSAGTAFGELRNNLVSINTEAAGELKAMVDGQIEKLYQEIKSKLDNGEFNDKMLSQINALKAQVAESSEEKAETLSRNMEFQLNGLLSTLGSRNAASDAALDTVSLKLNELANVLSKDGNKQIYAVLDTLSQKMDQVTDELKASPDSADQLAKRFAAIRGEIASKIDAQEAKVIDSLEQQVREIKTSLVDVLGQNEMIDSIAKNVRDVKENLGKDVKRIQTDLAANTVSSNLVQELISQINLLSEYMLQDNRADGSAAVATQIADLKNKIASSSSDKDLAGIRDEIVALKNSLGKKSVNDDVLMNLIDQVNQLSKDSKANAGSSRELDKVISSIGELNDQVQHLAKSVDLLKNKDMIAQSTGADIRMRATQVMLDKLTEIKFALEDAIRKTNDKERAIGMVKAVDKLTNQLGYQSGLTSPAGKLTQALGDLTDDLNQIPKN